MSLSSKGGSGQRLRTRRGTLLAVLGFGFFIDSAEDVALPMLFPAIRNSLGLGYGALSVISSIRIICQTASGPFWGMAADRFNRKWILVIGTGLWGVWTLACGFTTSYHQLLIVRVIACLGLGCLYPAAFSMVADSFAPRHRGKAIGAIGAVGMFGIVVGALVFGVLLEASDTGWRWAFILLGAASIFSGLVMAVTIRDPIRGAAEPELKDVITAEAADRFRFRVADIREIFRSKTVWVNFIQGIFLMTPINALTAFFVTWLVDDRGFSESEAPLIFGGVVMSLAVGSFVGGVVADWADVRWPRFGRIAVSQVSIVLALPAMAYMLISATTLSSILASAIFAGFFLDWTRRGVKQPLVQNVIRPELRSTAMALTEFVQGAAASVIIIAFGGFADSLGLTRTLIVLVCGFWSVSLLATCGYYLTYPREAMQLREEMKQRQALIVGEG